MSTGGFGQGLTVAEKEAFVAAVQARMSMLASSLTGEDDPDSLSDTQQSRWRHAGVTAQRSQWPSTSEWVRHVRSFEKGGN
jgi:hypothetical protein